MVLHHLIHRSRMGIMALHPITDMRRFTIEVLHLVLLHHHRAMDSDRPRTVSRIRMGLLPTEDLPRVGMLLHRRQVCLTG